MPADPMRVGVVGAGAMGSGIAQIAAQAGHSVVIADTRPEATRKAAFDMRASLDRLVGKGKLSSDGRAATLGRIEFIDAPLADMSVYRDCGLIIEAIVEDLGAKQLLFARLGAVVA
ncbi:MAG TPA: 3-hydroxyacyl-CoA dehydrogenase NAD-binding domain-containing protein, partial [Gemmatimonadaceae bacterium]